MLNEKFALKVNRGETKLDQSLGGTGPGILGIGSVRFGDFRISGSSDRRLENPFTT